MNSLYARLFPWWPACCILREIIVLGGASRMEAEWIADRATLRWLVRHHPDWTQAELASAVGRSRSWVVKWLPRLKGTAPDDLAALFSHSRARRTPPSSTPQGVVERILAIRDEPPEHLQRVPGPKAIL
jgi:hypothetical protein